MNDSGPESQGVAIAWLIVHTKGSLYFKRERRLTSHVDAKKKTVRMQFIPDLKVGAFVTFALLM
jgi:hypothetical protein